MIDTLSYHPRIKNLNRQHFNQRPLTADTFIVFTLVKHVFIGLRATPTVFAMIISRKKLNFSLKLIRIAAKEMRKGQSLVFLQF